MMTLTRYIEGKEKENCPSIILNISFIQFIDFAYDPNSRLPYGKIHILGREETIDVWEWDRFLNNTQR